MKKDWRNAENLMISKQMLLNSQISLNPEEVTMQEIRILTIEEEDPVEEEADSIKMVADPIFMEAGSTSTQKNQCANYVAKLVMW